MCSFLVYKGSKDRFNDDVNRFLKPRGPDFTTVTEINGYTFVHNLLSITGECTPQPFIDGDIVCVYNGQLYNFRDFGDYKSDGHCLIPLYREYGPKFIKKLDGEFAICLIDFNKNVAVVSKDVFGTKPLYVSKYYNEGFACASYADPLKKLGFSPVNPQSNRYYVIDLEKNEGLDSFDIKKWNLEQNIDSFEPWTAAFEESIRKRTQTDKGIFVGLSSGIDSGAISCECLKQNVDFTSYSILGEENAEVMEARWKLIKNHKATWKNPYLQMDSQRDIMNNCDEYIYNISSEYGDYKEIKAIHSDSGAQWLNVVCKAAKSDGFKVLLSGAGADEICSDYADRGRRIYPHSNFSGLFPDDLSSIFPWRSFYYSTMRDYLMKDEYITGMHGIEGRYPFLDPAAVQAFLNLTAKLKNSKYKNVIANYLEVNGFPHEPGVKRGF